MTIVHFKNLELGSVASVQQGDQYQESAPLQTSRTWTVGVSRDTPVTFIVRHPRFHLFTQTFTWNDDHGYDVDITQVPWLGEIHEGDESMDGITMQRLGNVRLFILHHENSYLTVKDALTGEDYFVGWCPGQVTTAWVPRGRSLNIVAGREDTVRDEALGFAFTEDDNYLLMNQDLLEPAPQEYQPVLTGRRAIQL